MPTCWVEIEESETRTRRLTPPPTCRYFDKAIAKRAKKTRTVCRKNRWTSLDSQRTSSIRTSIGRGWSLSHAIMMAFQATRLTIQSVGQLVPIWLTNSTSCSALRKRACQPGNQLGSHLRSRRSTLSPKLLTGDSRKQGSRSWQCKQ